MKHKTAIVACNGVEYRTVVPGSFRYKHAVYRDKYMDRTEYEATLRYVENSTEADGLPYIFYWGNFGRRPVFALD